MTETELGALEDERLVQYIRKAVDAGDGEAGREGLGVLVFRYEGLIKATVLLKVNPTDADDVVATVFMSAIKSLFSGNTPAEFRSWLMTITRRRIADYHRSGGLGGGDRPVDLTDEALLDTPSSDGEIEKTEAEIVVIAALEDLSDGHREVVRLHVLEGYSAAECAEKVNGQLGDALSDPMTEANVHQIASRFRAALRAALAGEGAKAHG